MNALPPPAPGTCILWEQDGEVRDAWDGIYASYDEALRELVGVFRHDFFMQPAPRSAYGGDTRMFVRAAYLRGGDVIDGEPLIGIVHPNNDPTLEFENVVVESVDGGYWESPGGWAQGFARDGNVVIYTDNTATPLVVPGDHWCIWVGVDER